LNAVSVLTFQSSVDDAGDKSYYGALLRGHL